MFNLMDLTCLYAHLPFQSPCPAHMMTSPEVLELADPECLALWNGLTLGYTETAGLPVS